MERERGLPRKSKLRAGASGFTIVELLVTLLIVGILASAVVPMAELSVKRSKEQELRRALREIRQALNDYKRAVDDGRIERKVGDSGYPPRLEILVNGVVDRKDPKAGRIYFLRRLPRDPLNPDAALPAVQTWGKRSYRSPPDDPREGEDVFDVYSLASGSGLNGIAYREW